MIKVVIQIEGTKDKNKIDFTVKKNASSTKDEVESANNFAKGLLYLCGGMAALEKEGNRNG